ncbi:MAG: class I SAM-dependent DNA methyltransferase, partial [Verrucomicrobia bacterium]|nr:class I SAM-dependent DNA methyltransferase [Verrucomicrobiota bacterium]
MTPAEFKTKWAKVSAKESAAYQSHFDDLCRLLKIPPPLEADPTGETFCFQKRVVKDAELFDIETPDASEPTERGFADVWKKGCFAWEYKGKKKNLDEAYKQLLRYRESLLNPPLLVVCDFDRFIVRTNFNGTVQEVHEFTNDQIDRPENLRLLRALFESPDFLKPQRTTAQVTEKMAEQMAEVARSLQGRESVELEDAKTRKEVTVAQRKNLRIARFLNRITFCLFAEDTGLLPKNLFTDILKASLHSPEHFAAATESLFRTMAKGGLYGSQRIRHFNGHLFEDSSVFELTEAEIGKLAEAAEADWQFIQPSIMGTLFERALEPEQRSQLGAHYTSEADIKTLVEPVLMSPLRREWAALKGELAAAYVKGKGTPAQRDKLAAFQKKLAAVSVLDPACGSGNFLYVSLQLLLGLEKEAVTYATQLGFKLAPQVSVQQLRAIEINPYAFELAQVSVQIGFLQWRRDNGFDNDRSPVLQNLDGFQNEDALLVPHFRSKAKTLKEAQA